MKEPKSEDPPSQTRQVTKQVLPRINFKLRVDKPAKHSPNLHITQMTNLPREQITPKKFEIGSEEEKQPSGQLFDGELEDDVDFTGGDLDSPLH